MMLIALAVTISGCIGQTAAVVTAAPFAIFSAEPYAAPMAVAGQDVVKLWVAPDVPPEYLEAISPLISTGSYLWTKEADAQIKLRMGVPQPGATVDAQWVYVPVAAFPTAEDTISWAEIQRYWRGEATLLALGAANQPPTLTISAVTLAWLGRLLGPVAPTVKIEVVPPDAIGPTLLQRRNGWSLVPFHRLEPNMKPLLLDGASVFNRLLDINAYPLMQIMYFEGAPALVDVLRSTLKVSPKWMATNRDLSKMTILSMTGVTALVRATANYMEINGIKTPARDILPFFADSDLIHTSNEVAFAKDCPNPDPFKTAPVGFCSKESYFELLKTMRLNIVELTGNHVNDWGPAALENSINLYDANKIGYFGGGRNQEDARKALIIVHNGNSIAFLGCNPAGPQGAWATAKSAGSAVCDDDFLNKEIPRLKAAGSIVSMSIQFNEYYQYIAAPEQIAFFGKYASLGADLVMGTQAHVPQGFAFFNGSFIHYGIGNLYFDQMDAINTRQMFADKLIIYNGKHISTVLFTGLIEDYARPRPMTPAERKDFLKMLFKASGW